MRIQAPCQCCSMLHYYCLLRLSGRFRYWLPKREMHHYEILSQADAQRITKCSLQETQLLQPQCSLSKNICTHRTCRHHYITTSSLWWVWIVDYRLHIIQCRLLWIADSVGLCTLAIAPMWPYLCRS